MTPVSMVKFSALGSAELPRCLIGAGLSFRKPSDPLSPPEPFPAPEPLPRPSPPPDGPESPDVPLPGPDPIEPSQI